MAKPMTEPLSRFWRPTKHDIGRTPRTVRRRAGEPERQRGGSESIRTFAPAGIGSSPKAVATRLSSPPPPGTQIRPAMDPLYGMSRHSAIWIDSRIGGVSRWIVGRSINISDAGITLHQFPTARIPAGKRLADRRPRRIKGGSHLCPGHRPAAQCYRSNSQSKPLHLSLRVAIPRHIRWISVMLELRSAPPIGFDGGVSRSWKARKMRAADGRAQFHTTVI